MVGDCHKTSLPRFVVCSRLEQVEKSGQAVDFGFVEPEKEYSRQCRNEENCLVRGRSPEKAGDFGVVVEVITGGHHRSAIAEPAAGALLSRRRRLAHEPGDVCQG